jgi:dolichol-phosphate mannosyltransferase
MRLSVIVPLFNEEESIQPMVEEIRLAVMGYEAELILVDDGSRDQTVARIPREPWIKIVALAQNTGQSAAMYAGIMAAEGEVIALLDGDLQNDPADIPKLLALLEQGADLACGWRVNRQDTWFKRVQSRVANAVRSRFTGDGVHDTGCTLKAMRRECRTALFPFTGMHRFIPALIGAAGYRVVELPVHHRARQHGSSKYTFSSRAVRATLDMLGVKWLTSRRFDVRLRTDINP